ncbi:MAG: phage tail tape measure protein [Leptospiraceae bacterium]|nr:phage tail tape measure protein [Leptospiraceae bacterium]
MSLTGSSVFQLGAVLTLKDATMGAVAGAQKRFAGLRKELGENDAAVKKLDKSMGAIKLGGKLLAGAGAVAGAMLAIRYETSELEGSLKTLGLSSQDVDKLSDSAGKMAGQFGIAKSVLLTGMYDIQSATGGLTTDQLDAFASSISATARATKGDFAQLSKTFGMVYNQFGKSSGLDAGAFAAQTADVFAMAVKQYRTDGAALEQAFNSAGSSAANLGITLGEQTAVLGNLMNTMTPGEAGTAWKAFTGKIDEGFGKLGVSYKAMDGSLLNTADLLENLKGKFGDSLDPAELSQLNKAFGEEGAKVVLNLLSQTGQLRGAIQTMKEVDGTAIQMASQQLNTVAGAWDKLKNGIGAMFDSIAKGSDGPLMGMLSMVNSLIDSYQNLSPPMKNMIGNLITWGAIAAGALGLVLTLGGAWSLLTLALKHNIAWQWMSKIATAAWSFVSGGAALATKALTVAQWALNAAFWANPITWIVAAVVVAIGIIIYFRKEIMAFTAALWENEKAMGATVLVLGQMMGPIGWLLSAAYFIGRYWDELSVSMSNAYNVFAKWLDLPLWNVSASVEKEIGAVANLKNEVDKVEEKKSGFLENAMNKMMQGGDVNIDSAGLQAMIPPPTQNIQMPQQDINQFATKYQTQETKTAQEITKTVNLYFKNLAQTIHVNGNTREQNEQAGGWLNQVLTQFAEVG